LSLTKREEMIIDILNNIVDKMSADIEDKDEIRTKIEKLDSLYWKENTGWE
jgi:CRISPR/Cas system CSM-associated protein Csm2 small subunit